jgi:hypothetical protein
MHISKAIDEMTGGYSVNILTAKSNDDIQEGGSALNEDDLYIPFGLYYQNDRAEYSFYKPQKAGTVDTALFEYLFNAVSKGGKSGSTYGGKPTRKMDIKPVANKKTHRAK